jgi:hypothetical protein
VQSCSLGLEGWACLRGEQTQRMEARSPRVRTFTKACAVCSSGLSGGNRKQGCHKAYTARVLRPPSSQSGRDRWQWGSPCSRGKWRKAPQAPSRYMFITRSSASTFCSSAELGSILGMCEALLRLDSRMHLWADRGCEWAGGGAEQGRTGTAQQVALSYRIRCPPGSLRRQFTKPTTPEVGQSTAVSHTG